MTRRRGLKRFALALVVADILLFAPRHG